MSAGDRTRGALSTVAPDALAQAAIFAGAESMAAVGSSSRTLLHAILVRGREDLQAHRICRTCNRLGLVWEASHCSVCMRSTPSVALHWGRLSSEGRFRLCLAVLRLAGLRGWPEEEADPSQDWTRTGPTSSEAPSTAPSEESPLTQPTEDRWLP